MVAGDVHVRSHAKTIKKIILKRSSSHVPHNIIVRIIKGRFSVVFAEEFSLVGSRVTIWHTYSIFG